jgi:PAS domain S-box-containing protein
VLEALPELRGQGFDELLKGVIKTGIPYIANEVSADIVRHNQLETIYVDLVYQPQRKTGTGQISGVLVVATDVTQQVRVRQKIEEAESTLRGAIELAELATWSLNIEKGTFRYSTRFMDWLGFSEDTKSMDEAYNPLPDDYRQPVADAIAAVIQPGASGLYRNEHPIINRLTGQVRIIHAQARTFYDAQGKPVKLVGTAQDITEQRKTQYALERQVQERTEELEATNEELAATNEELATTNEELAESNQLLSRSNQNLEQFAYIASHDLQEPLRKIQQFSDLLKNQYAAHLGDGTSYLERMQSAATRMSMLIKDLLTFSRISSGQDTTEPVSLAQVVNTVLTDLELAIQESGAQVTAEPLPTVLGDSSQLEQLFQNLLSNALKFRRANTVPLVRVRAETVAADNLPAMVSPTRTTKTYHCISVSDNGIGFDEKYIDRIFQVFQRLHGKNEFIGTGVGLAICEKVAANHGGAITATSKPGKGATFSVYLPVF